MGQLLIYTDDENSETKYSDVITSVRYLIDGNAPPAEEDWELMADYYKINLDLLTINNHAAT
jgi:hypothetical protein